MTPDESPPYISTVYRLGFIDTKERRLGTQGASELLKRAAKAIAGLGHGSIRDLVLNEGSYYAVGWVDVYYYTTEPRGAPVSNHFNVMGGGDTSAPLGSRERKLPVPELLRRTADVIEGLSGVEVEGLVLHNNDEMDGIGRGSWISVYYRKKNS